MADEAKTTVVENENKNKLFLRFFRKDERNGKILTRLQRKVFFPPYNKQIKPGWYIASVIEEKETFGIMDVTPLDEVPKQLWHVDYIKGIYVKRNHDKGIIEIYPVIPRDNLETEEPILIYSFPMHKKGKADHSINDVLKVKLQEAMDKKKERSDAKTTKNKK